MIDLRPCIYMGACCKSYLVVGHPSASVTDWLQLRAFCIVLNIKNMKKTIISKCDRFCRSPCIALHYKTLASKIFYNFITMTTNQILINN